MGMAGALASCGAEPSSPKLEFYVLGSSRIDLKRQIETPRANGGTRSEMGENGGGKEEGYGAATGYVGESSPSSS